MQHLILDIQKKEDKLSGMKRNMIKFMNWDKKSFLASSSFTW